MITVSATLGNTALRALPATSTSPPLITTGRNQSKKVVGYSVGALSVTEKRSADFWRSPNEAACPLPDPATEKPTIQHASPPCSPHI